MAKIAETNPFLVWKFDTPNEEWQARVFTPLQRKAISNEITQKTIEMVKIDLQQSAELLKTEQAYNKGWIECLEFLLSQSASAQEEFEQSLREQMENRENQPS